jgi:hypothetical protein
MLSQFTFAPPMKLPSRLGIALATAALVAAPAIGRTATSTDRNLGRILIQIDKSLFQSVDDPQIRPSRPEGFE